MIHLPTTITMELRMRKITMMTEMELMTERKSMTATTTPTFTTTTMTESKTGLTLILIMMELIIGMTCMITARMLHGTTITMV